MYRPSCEIESWSLTRISSYQMPKYLFHFTYFHLLEFIEKHKLYPINYFKKVIKRHYMNLKVFFSNISCLATF